MLHLLPAKNRLYRQSMKRLHDVINEFLQKSLQFNTSQIIITGDLNFVSSNWSTTSWADQEEEKMLDFFVGFKFEQLIASETSKILNVILTSEPQLKMQSVFQSSTASTTSILVNIRLSKTELDLTLNQKI